MTDLQNDIDKYLRGELPASEMHALEKKALDDPFLADALEGASFLGPDDFNADLAELSERLQGRLEPEETPQINLFWIWTARVAAGFLLLMLATFIINLLVTRQANTEKLAFNDPASLKIAAAQDTIDIYLPPAYERTSGNVRTAAWTTDRRNSTRDVHAMEAAVSFGISRVSVEEVADNEERTVEANLILPERIAGLSTVPAATAPLTEKDNPIKQKATPAAEAKDLYGKVSDKATTLAAMDSTNADGVLPSSVVRGRITSSEDGAALPGVNVVVKGTNTGTITDAEGNFEIPVTNQHTTLQLAYVGMQNQEIPVAPGAALNVVMDADVQSLSEVVVVGHSTRAPAVEPATPDGGRKAFEAYIEQSLQYPDQALENNIEGRVTIEFTVDTSGELSDFKIVKGLGYGCDEEAIRLIKQGPKWTPTRKTTEPVKDHVKVRLKFAIPRKK